jgi:hypothetical protein
VAYQKKYKNVNRRADVAYEKLSTLISASKFVGIKNWA